jgi:hypothetical protein
MTLTDEDQLILYNKKYNINLFPSCQKDFNYDQVYYKLTNAEENHNGFKYKDGYNFDIVAFDPTGSCKPGGLYFTKLEHLYQFEGFGTNLREVRIPKNIAVYHDYSINYDKWKSPVLYLGERNPVDSAKVVNLLFGTSDGNNRFILTIMLNSTKSDVIELLKDFIMKDKLTKLITISNICDLVYHIKNDKEFIPIIHSKFNKLIIDDISSIINRLYGSTDRQVIRDLIENFYMSHLHSLKKDYKTDYKPTGIFKDLNNSSLFDELPDILLSTKSVIAGSYALKHYNGDSFVAGDIDIFCNQKYFDKLDDFLRKYSTDIQTIGECYDILPNIKRVNSYETKVAKIQVITLDDDCDPVKSVNESFDLDICKIMYDGKSLFTDQNKENISNRVANICLDSFQFKSSQKSLIVHGIAKTLVRVIKYTARGYTVKNINDLIDLLYKQL